MWNKLTQRFRARVGSITPLTYTYTLSPDETFSVKPLPDKSYFLVPSCGCAIPKWNPISLTVSVNFKADEVPVHLVREGKNKYHTTKTIDVHAIRNGEEVVDTLTFEVEVFDPNI